MKPADPVVAARPAPPGGAMMSRDTTMLSLPRGLSANFGSLGEHLRHYSFTAMICVGVATILWTASDRPFVEQLVFSLCIGLCIHTITILALYFVRRLPIWVVWLVTVPTGAMGGLAMGAALNDIPLGDVFSSGSPIFSLVISLISSYVFYSYFSMLEMRDRLREEEMNRVLSEKRLVETQMRLLQSQIEPHFLFNTLSHVISLIGTDAERAETMLRKLSQFLRASLRRSRNPALTLQDELDLLADYLSILKVRMGDRLAYTFNVSGEVAGVRFPPLILQPLVENAVVHGLEPLEHGGTIVIAAKREGDVVSITITDCGAGLLPCTPGGGFGINNVRERLRMCYGDAARLELSDVQPHGLRVAVVVPAEGCAA